MEIKGFTTPPKHNKINKSDFHDYTRNFHDPWVGTDTPGPGEAVFAIRFIDKQIFTIKNPMFQSKEITKDN